MSELTKRIANLSSKQRKLLDLLKAEKLTHTPQSDVAETLANIRSKPFSLISEEDKLRLPKNVEDAYPLSSVQLGMLFHMMEHDPEVPGPPPYHNVNSYHIRFPFNQKRLQRAVDSVVLRHPVLRTSFDLTTYTEPLQLVHSEARLKIRVEDLRHLGAKEQDAVFQEFVQSENLSTFDLTQAPLLRLTFHLLSDELVWFSLTEIHIISDGWSTHLTMSEIVEDYYALLNEGVLKSKEPLAVTFRDFVRLEKLAINAAENKRFWEQKLNNGAYAELPRLPRQFHTPVSWRDHKLYYHVPDELMQKLQPLSALVGVPFKSIMLTAHLKMISLMSGQTNISSGLVFNGRPEVKDGEQVRGVFLNTLPLFINLDKGSWLDLIRQVFRAETEILPFRRYPVSILQQKWGDRALFDAAFSYHDFHTMKEIVNTGKVTAVSSGVDLSRTNYPLITACDFSPKERNLTMILEYDVQEFAKEQIEAIYGYYEQILWAMANQPHEEHISHSFLPSEEAKKLLLEWNNTSDAYPQNKCLHTLFEAQAAQSPEAIAVVFAGQCLTYKQFNQRANQLARRLQSMGVGPDVSVGLFMERSLEMVVALVAILKAGGAYVPLDPNYPTERLSFIFQDAKMPVLLTQERLTEQLPPYPGCLLCVDTMTFCASTHTPNPTGSLTPDNAAYVIYTSGSTGQPKGVVISHEAIVNHINWKQSQFGFSQTDCMLHKTPFHFDASVWEFFTPLLSGGKSILAKSEGHRDAEYLIKTIQKYNITTIQLVPSQLQMLLDNGTLSSCCSLRLVVCGGEALSAEQVRGLYDALPHISFHNLYGPTEATIDSTSWPCQPLSDQAIAPIGRPLSNIQTFILNANLQPVPIGVIGELHVGGLGLARGYLNRPDLTAEKFIPNHLARQPGQRLYKTGDLVRYLPNGIIEFLGRIDFQVKVRGFRIELGEIEATFDQHPAVRRCVVLARDDTPPLGKRLVAYLVPADGTPPSHADLRDYLRQWLPTYMIPTDLVWLEALPLTTNGKINRRALPVPDHQPEELTHIFVAPRNPQEEILAGIWAQVLKLERIGIYDNVFDLGAHSLIITQVISRIRQLFQIELPLRMLFDCPTVAELAQKITEAQHSEQALTTLPLVTVDRQNAIPLSFAQQRLWFLNQLEPDSPAYHISAALRLTGQLNVPVLIQGLNELINRHEILRTSFPSIEGKPSQVINLEQEIELHQLDLSDLPPDEQEAEVRRLTKYEAQEPFDLAHGPLLRTLLIRVGEKEHIGLITLHHIIADAWSMGILVEELVALYGAFLAERPSPLTDLSSQYADFAHWQRQWLQGDILERQLNYWRERLEAPLPTLTLPTDRPRPSVQSFRGDSRAFSLDRTTTNALVALSRREGVTLFMLLLAAFKVLLFRYSGQTDLLVGSPVAGRNQQEVETLIGFFVNTLVLRTDLSGNPTFRGLLRRVREVTLGAYSHQDLPFERLVEEAQPERDLSRNPLFQVMFALQNVPGETLTLPDLTLSPLEAPTQTAQFDLELALEETPNGLFGVAEYSTDLFDEETICRLLNHYQTVLSSIIADPGQSITELTILPEEEEKQILLTWNETANDYPDEQLFTQLFEKQAAQTPHAVAAVYAGKSITYDQLNRRANRLARFLKAHGVGDDVIVALLAERSLDLLTAILAVFKAGGAYLPLDPRHPTHRYRQILEQSGVPLVLVTNDYHKEISQAIIALPKEHQPCCFHLENVLKQANYLEENLPQSSEAESLAYVIFTSGSTGRPKGAMVHQQGMLNHLFAKCQDLQIRPNDIIAQNASQCFDISVWQFLAGLLVGSQVHIYPDKIAYEPALFLQAIVANQVTVLEVVPSFMRAILEECRRTGNTPTLHSLRWLIPTGEALSPALSRQWQTYFPDLPLLNAYGPTECSDDVTHYPITQSPALDVANMPIGRPVINTQIYILDRNLQPAPIGVPGELLVGGVGVGRGYLYDAYRTALNFIPNPFTDKVGSRLYRTGDLARFLSDGNIEFLGRIDFQVKIRGFRIEPGEIETVLEQHPAINQCIVLARDDDPVAGKRLVGYLTSASNEALSATELRDYLQHQLPAYMVPTAFVWLDSLPLTANGKVDRNLLLPPGPQANELAGTYSPPRTPTEEILTAIWASVLDLECLGIHDNIFNLGAHSLLITQAASRLRQAFAIELPLRTLFEHPTVARLAEKIEEASSSTQPPLSSLQPIARNGHLPLSFAQQRLWFLNQMIPNSPAYNIPRALSLVGPLDLSALEASLNQVVARHEILRTNFKVHQGTPLQSIASTLTLTLPLVDLQALTTAVQEKETRRLANREARHSFNLADETLLRMTILRRAPDDHVILLVMHHIISDGLSMNILVQEMLKFYVGLTTRQPTSLPKLPLQYADFAHWQRQWLQGDVLEAQLAYWQQQLVHPLPVLNLPTDRPRPSRPTFQSNIITFSLDQLLSNKLQALSREEEVTLFMALLAIFKTLLYRYADQTNIIVGTPIAGRNRSELEKLIGFFVNTLALRTDLSGGLTFRELLHRVRKTTLDAYSHQDLPFERLVEEIQPERDLSRNPLFQVMFVFQNVGQQIAEHPQSLQARPLEVDNGATQMDLVLNINETRKGLYGELVYMTDLFDEQTVRQMVTHFQIILASVTDNPDQPLAEITLLSQTERWQLLGEWADTEVKLANQQCLHQLFEAQAQQTPNAVALIYEEQQLTYAALDKRANQLAHLLQQHGVGADSMVGLCFESGPDLIVAILATLKAGGAYVPLDPSLPIQRLAYMISDTKPTVMLTTETLLDLLPPHSETVICLDNISYLRQPDTPPANASTLDNLAYVIYTSGSTGQPKGVLVEHRAISNTLTWRQSQFPFCHSDRLLQTIPFGFDASVGLIFGVFQIGATLVIPSPKAENDLNELADLIQEKEITVLPFNTARIPGFLDAAKNVQFPSLRLLMCGGEALHVSIKERCLEQFAVPLYNLYGPTEVAIDATGWHCQSGSTGQRIVPIGRPIANKQAYLLDAQGQLVPVGIPGELYVGGFLARGYLNQPKQTAEKFLPHPFVDRPGARLYRTGDLARYRPDGVIEFHGRIDDQVKIRGFRVEIGEIESRLVQFPNIQQAVVLLHEAEDDKKLVTYLATRAETPPSVEQLRSFLLETLPTHMVPTAFIFLDTLPLTPNGKVDYQALPAPTLTRPYLEADFIAPQTATEQKLAAIWRDVLEIDQIGIHDNFFALGGHSLRAAQVVARVQDAFVIQIPLPRFFEASTIAELAKILDVVRRLTSGEQQTTADGLSGNEDEFEEGFL